ncbi:pyridoxal-phosphate dependent enzyme [Conexibacter sp. JD483]|uniref:pyridoxal-phosphate dependent enzyme n=1 Tax=unclassified Conexibacter TaxID=2627773 RepID=UPI0027216044|nr:MULTISPECIES: pyridoxal-phosphate dependent enzyme [unclassified Conexibacter]MDO8187085.1 pyridoxal-phosphate dependent enzyme [Conexibacter sp. CPCC 205706]MDO8200943.1 pyridoxal-phosphate dependent enzyme [Conexibacter sp. CPCC 205762]MDR9372223.1 pyridoxal-phosphate dependent enzyme [Conexibacter sp. JD483]
MTGIARHAALLPPVAGEWVTLGEGATPTVALPRLGAAIGLPRLRAKCEHVNPTGSYKDRIAALSLTLACERGQRGWIATSSGNAGTSLGAYGARAGLPGLLFATPTITREKLVPIEAVGTTVVRVADIGTGGSAAAAERVFATVRALAAEHDLFLGVTANALNPDGMRGADTIGHELAEADPPDVVYVPTGGGGLSVCVARGLADAGAAGTRVVVAQPDGCAPIALALDGRLDQPRVERCTTAISGLQLPAPPDGGASVARVRASGGWGSAVADAAILEAQRQLARLEGVFVEPAAATGVAAAAADRAAGRLAADADVVVILTGSGAKDLASAAVWAGGAGDCQPEEVERVAAGWLAGLAGASAEDAAR